MNETETHTASVRRQKEIKDLAIRAVGRTERECRAAVKDRGFRLRVVGRNGKPLVTTRDYKPERISVRIDNGIVVEAQVG